MRENPLFRDLSGEQLHAVNRAFRDRGFETGETIVREGEPGDHLYIVALGLVKLFRSTEEGESALIDVLGSGDYFGSLPGYGPGNYGETAVARSTVCALTIDTHAFRNIIESYPPVALRTIDALSNRLRLAHELVTQLRGYGAEAKVAYVLLRLADKLGQPWEGTTLIRAPLSREEIASMAGITTETCSRILSSFRREGYLRTGREWIAIANTEALKDLTPG